MDAAIHRLNAVIARENRLHGVIPIVDAKTLSSIRSDLSVRVLECVPLLLKTR